jgi:hypothetical protein
MTARLAPATVHVAGIFRAIGFAVDRLGQGPGSEGRLREVLGGLGEAAAVGRVCSCRTEATPEGLRGEPVEAWSRPGVGRRAARGPFTLEHVPAAVFWEAPSARGLALEVPRS